MLDRSADVPVIRELPRCEALRPHDPAIKLDVNPIKHGPPNGIVVLALDT